MDQVGVILIQVVAEYLLGNGGPVCLRKGLDILLIVHNAGHRNAMHIFISQLEIRAIKIGEPAKYFYVMSSMAQSVCKLKSISFHPAVGRWRITVSYQQDMHLISPIDESVTILLTSSKCLRRSIWVVIL
jgi:hypothetical protein